MTRLRLLLAVFALAALVAGARRAAPDDFVWRTDLAAARELAAQDGKPLLLLFRCVP